MGVLDRIEARADRWAARRQPKALKAFSMPPFWSDGARVSLLASSLTPEKETIAENFEGYVSDLYKTNGIVFAAIVARARVFAQARIQFQRMKKGRPTELWSDDSLSILENPWENGTTGELLTNMEVDSSVAGNFFSTIVDEEGRIGRRARRDANAYIARMRPDWCTLIIRARSGNPFNVDARVVALSFAPPGMRNDPLLLTRKEFAHYSPMPDPIARFRGMSWLTPIIREAQADKAYTDHKLAFLKNGATPNLVVKVGDDVDGDEFQAFVQQFKDDYEGATNAYKTLFLAGGADVTPLTVDFKQLDLKSTQGALETRIASAAGVHPVIAGLSEGLQGSSLNEGNFRAARRLFVDSTIRDLWGKAAPSLRMYAPPPTGSRLWYDDRDIPFLREDASDEAATFLVQVQAARHAADGGWDPDAAIDAAKARDIALLKGHHTGMLSVQLHDPSERPALPAGPSGGNGDMPTLDRVNGNGRVPAAVGSVDDGR